MALFILLNPEKAVYRPGDEVKGFVQFCGLNMDKVAFVKITFRGQLESMVWGHASTIERDHVLLFKMDALTLYDDRSTDQRSTSMWEFSFRFPVSIIPRRLESWDAGAVTAFPKQPLPISYRIVTPQGHCSVSYTLRATIQSHRSKPQHYFKYLTLVPTAGANDMSPQWLNYKSKNYVARGSDLLPSQAAAAVSGREKIMSFWPWAKLPTLRLEMTTSLPRHLRIGEPLRMCLHVKVLEPRPRDIPLPSVPKLYLQKVIVSIERVTDVRIRANAFFRYEYLFARTFTYSRTILPGNNIVKVDQKSFALSPSIRLSSIQQQDTIHATFVVTTAGGRHKRRFKQKASIVIQPQAASNTAVSQMTEDLHEMTI